MIATVGSLQQSARRTVASPYHRAVAAAGTTDVASIETAAGPEPPDRSSFWHRVAIGTMSALALGGAMTALPAMAATNAAPAVTKPADAAWTSYKGNYNGQDYHFDHPPTWKMHSTTGGIVTYNPDNNEAAEFFFTHGLGPMDPQSFTRGILQQLGYTNVRILAHQEKGPVPTQIGNGYQVDWQVLYTSPKGQEMRAHVGTTLYMKYYPGLGIDWNGYANIQQAPPAQWEHEVPTLTKIATSFDTP